MRNYSIVGTEHRGADVVAFMKDLAGGCPAVLVREPRNEHDPNAVAVWIDGRKVGYVPKAQNKVLAAFIDQTGECNDTARAGQLIAMDQNPATSRAIDAEFVRSPNSNYPMVKV